MLAAKHKYFSSIRDYEEFASLLAYSTYSRMIDPNKSQIKSVLNYMKSIMSFRKMTFNTQKRQKIIDPNFDLNWDPVSYVEHNKDIYINNNREVLFEGVVDIFKRIPNYVEKNIPKVYKSDKIEYKNIYISSLLSLINKVTLPLKYEEKLSAKLDTIVKFDEARFYKKHLDDNIIL